jgi:hypothetical protein
MLCAGVEVDLTPEEEEVASFYAAMLNSDHVKNPVRPYARALVSAHSSLSCVLTRCGVCNPQIFNKNFFRDWTKVLKKSGKVSSNSRLPCISLR